MIQTPEKFSYLLAILAVALVLHFHLLPAVIAGLAVHVITTRMAQRVPGHWGDMAREAILGLVAVCVVVALSGIGFGLWSFLVGHHGVTDLLTAMGETLEHLKRTLPVDLAASLPDTVEEIQTNLVGYIRENGRHLSQIGMEGIKIFAHVLLGMVVGGLTALHAYKRTDQWPVLSAALHARLRVLCESFYKVVFAQAKISGLNTLLTAIYLTVILPLCGVHLPMMTALIIFTFIAGLLPVVGNLISNTVIVVISLGVSLMVGGASLLFLVLVHKLEYFTNAKIVGGEVHAKAWELLCAMILMEAIFGIGGMVAAPIVYAWLKSELKNAGLV